MLDSLPTVSAEIEGLLFLLEIKNGENPIGRKQEVACHRRNNGGEEGVEEAAKAA